jgi:DNA transposition AAA+ family ATPase
MPPTPPIPDPASEMDDVNERIRQLGRRRVLEVPQMLEFHSWLDGKRLARRPCRVVGESRTGKTVSCNTYRLKSKVIQTAGAAPLIPVMYWHCPENLSVSSLFVGLLENLHYQATRGRISELRERLYRVLQSCQVEMIIFDEAQRATAQALSEIRDIADILEIAVVLVGTDRLNAVIQADEQVLYRFLPAYRFARLDSEALREMTAFWELHVLQLPEPSNLLQSQAQDLLLQATRGYIGLLDQILCEAAIRALQSNQKQIALALLRQVVKECSLAIK